MDSHAITSYLHDQSDLQSEQKKEKEHQHFGDEGKINK